MTDVLRRLCGFEAPAREIEAMGRIKVQLQVRITGEMLDIMDKALA